MYVDAMYNNVDPIPWLEGVGHPAGGGGGATSFTVGGGGGGLGSYNSWSGSCRHKEIA